MFLSAAGQLPMNWTRFNGYRLPPVPTSTPWEGNVTDNQKSKIIERIKRMTSVDSNGCWLWRGSVRDGYGRTKIPNSRLNASVHRLSYSVFKKEIPEGLVIDHLCRVRGCVNPDHLEPVTKRENELRAPRWKVTRTHCPNGHEYREGNLRNTKGGGKRCLACYRAQRGTVVS